MFVDEIIQELDLYHIEYSEIANIIGVPCNYIEQLMNGNEITGTDEDNLRFAIGKLKKEKCDSLLDPGSSIEETQKQKPKTKGFILYYDLAPLFQSMSNEQTGILTKELFKYAIDGIEPQEVDPMTNMAFQMIKPKIDENEQKYIERCEVNRKAVQKRWDKKK